MENKNIIEEFLIIKNKIKKYQIIMIVVTISYFVINILLLILFSNDKISTELLIISYIITTPIFVITGILYARFIYKEWRCPKCGKSLSREISPKFCRNCGIQLMNK